ncbi:MAG TPA: hypothetical protein VFL85_00620 [Candidatus Saccharimonadales bacterium]|nr:hypothetical protein [Candidatus Saccharimonadales bacterium]
MSEQPPERPEDFQDYSDDRAPKPVSEVMGEVFEELGSVPEEPTDEGVAVEEDQAAPTLALSVTEARAKVAELREAAARGEKVTDEQLEEAQRDFLEALRAERTQQRRPNNESPGT